MKKYKALAPELMSAEVKRLATEEERQENYSAVSNVTTSTLFTGLEVIL